MADLINFDLFSVANVSQAVKDQVIEQYIDKNEKQLKVIDNISRVNLFVGANNSGKSRLLRENFHNRQFNFADLGDLDITGIEHEMNRRYDNLDCKKLKEEFDQIDKESKSEIVEFILDKTSRIRIEQNSMTPIEQLTRYLFAVFTGKIKSNVKSNEKRVYIPTLRGVECFKQTMNSLKQITHEQGQYNSLKTTPEEQKALDVYIDQVETAYQVKTRKVYFKNNLNSDLSEIHTGESLYKDIQRKLLGKKVEREKIKAFEQFLKEHFFENKEISLIPNMSEKYLWVNIEGEKDDRELHNLGDGIKHLIVITYKMFMCKDEETFFFIEEPELNLHPSLQRKLIEVMLSPIFAKQQFFITTHSNHLLDLTLDYNNLSVYKFKKIKLEDAEKVMFTRVRKGDNSLLQELGVKASSVFLSNCTIWVEGITDRLFIRKYLELYQSDLNGNQLLKEDIDYAFVEYGGSNITHWNFTDTDNKELINAPSLNKNIFLIADNDFPKEDTAKDSRHKRFAKTLRENYYKLPVREIENLVSVKVLKKIIIDREGNARVLDNITITEDMYKERYIGEFIDDVIPNRKKKYTKQDGNILYDKKEFCHSALNHLESYDDLSKNAKELAGKVYDFINGHKNV